MERETGSRRVSRHADQQSLGWTARPSLPRHPLVGGPHGVPAYAWHQSARVHIASVSGHKISTYKDLHSLSRCVAHSESGDMHRRLCIARHVTNRRGPRFEKTGSLGDRFTTHEGPPVMGPHPLRVLGGRSPARPPGRALKILRRARDRQSARWA